MAVFAECSDENELEKLKYVDLNKENSYCLVHVVGAVLIHLLWSLFSKVVVTQFHCVRFVSLVFPTGLKA